MKLAVMAAALIALAASAAATEEQPATATACNIGRAVLRPYAGRPYTPRIGADLQRRSRAAVLRVVRPGQTMTMDFRADRLTLRLDKRGRLAGASCG